MNSDTIYDMINIVTDAEFSEICEEDANFYQACFLTTGYQQSSKSLLCEQFICQSLSHNKSMACNNKAVCSNVEIEDICDNNEQEQKKCDGICDESDCIDEATCHGLTYGKYCTKDNIYHQVHIISVISWVDAEHDCHIWAPYRGDNARTLFLNDYTGPLCQHYTSGLTVPIFNYTRCAALEYNPRLVVDPELWWINSTKISYCANMMDQTNCTDPARIAMSCMVHGHQTTISKYAICHGRPGLRICDDGIENSCLNLSPSCFVHKHQVCDGINDCPDNSDELDLNCQQKTDAKCIRILGDQELPLPLSWLGDGTIDCISMLDERPIWPTCGVGETKRFVKNNESCSDDLLCLNSETKFVPLHLLCDMVNTCGSENEMCKQSRGSPDLFKKVTRGQSDNIKYFPQCMKGLESLQTLNITCATVHLMYPTTDIYGLDKRQKIIMPKQTLNCDNTFGEVYVLSSCSGKCAASACPLTKPIKYDSCTGQYPNRIYTVANREYLTFVTPTQGSYQNNYFLCKNNGCVDYNNVCDLVDDCGDGSDEEICTNQFQCNSSGTRIPKWQKCDGIINCADLTDECNEECGKDIIEGVPLKISSWLIGILAVILNSFTAFKSMKSIKNATTCIGLLNKLFIAMIGLGDFLVGAYLFSISLMYGLFGSSYCFKQVEWLSSRYCSVLGAVSTIGSELSLFSMTTLSFTRLFGIKNAMRIAPGFSTKSYAKVITLVVFIALVSVCIAISPLLPQFEDFFVNGMKYESNPLFVGFPDKNVHLKVIQAYYGRLSADQTSIKWVTALALVDGMFSKTYGGLKRQKIDFYGNDGVCLFKYFVSKNDPQRIFSWTVLGINFFCFLIIMISYLCINLTSKKSSKRFRNNSRQVIKQNRRMQRKISIIIATDFCCWVPFVIISCLHSASVLDATPWYSLISVVILPINSVINPLLYDNTITKYLLRPLNRVEGIGRSVSTVIFNNNSTKINAEPEQRYDHEFCKKENLPNYTMSDKVLMNQDGDTVQCTTAL